MLGEHYTKLTL